MKMISLDKLLISKGLDPKKKTYQCANCDKLFNWDENSRWFGSWYQQEKDPSSIVIVCSEDCGFSLGWPPQTKNKEDAKK